MWQSISNLPKEEGLRFLAWCDENKESVILHYYDNGEDDELKLHDDANDYYPESWITHWMPLPKKD